MEDTLQMTPQPFGRLLPIRPDGTLGNDADRQSLPEGLVPLANLIASLYRDELGDRLRGVYIRGSAVRGNFVDGVSDFDTWALVDHVDPEGPVFHTLEAFEEALAVQFPQVTEVEMCFTSLARLQAPDARFAAMLLATHSACWDGQDVLDQLGPFRPGADTLGHALHLKANIEDLLAHPTDDVADDCRWICKQVLRAGVEIHAGDHGQYTRDLFPCYALFAAFHPEESPILFLALELAVSPTDDAETLQEVLVLFQQKLVPLLDRSATA